MLASHFKEKRHINAAPKFSQILSPWPLIFLLNARNMNLPSSNMAELWAKTTFDIYLRKMRALANAQQHLLTETEGINPKTLPRRKQHCPICGDSYFPSSDEPSVPPLKLKTCGCVSCAPCMKAHIEGGWLDSNQCPRCGRKLFDYDLRIR
jgi:hypothetical protein